MTSKLSSEETKTLERMRADLKREQSAGKQAETTKPEPKKYDFPIGIGDDGRPFPVSPPTPPSKGSK